MAMQNNPNQSTNLSGYSDKTAYNAIRSITKQSVNADIKANLVIATIKTIAELAGYSFVGRFVIQDKHTKNIYR